jgi:hypothetical protein
LLCVLKGLAVPQLGMVQLLSWDLSELVKMELAFTSINMPGIKVLSLNIFQIFRAKKYPKKKKKGPSYSF